MNFLFLGFVRGITTNDTHVYKGGGEALHYTQQNVMSEKQPPPVAYMLMAICDISSSAGHLVFDSSVMEIFCLAVVEEKVDDRNALGFNMTPTRSPSLSSQKKIATSRN